MKAIPAMSDVRHVGPSRSEYVQAAMLPTTKLTSDPCLGPARVRLICRLASLGLRLVTSRQVGEFTQMSARQCRECVEEIEQWFDKAVREENG
jgi:hypothetical protein